MAIEKMMSDRKEDAAQKSDDDRRGRLPWGCLQAGTGIALGEHIEQTYTERGSMKGARIRPDDCVGVREGISSALVM